MADTPAAAAPSPGKGFNLARPGVREYLIIGGLALVIGYWYFSRQKKSAASQQASQGVGTAGTAAAQGNGQQPTYAIIQGGQSLPAQPTSGAFKQWQGDHQSSPQPAAAGTPNSGAGVPAALQNLTGMSLAQATQAIESAGWSVNSVNISGTNTGVNQPLYQQHTVTAAQPHTSGMAGQYSQNSVSLSVSP